MRDEIRRRREVDELPRAARVYDAAAYPHSSLSSFIFLMYFIYYCMFFFFWMGVRENSSWGSHSVSQVNT